MTMPAETKTTRTISRQHERMSSTATMDESSTIRTPPPATTSGRGNGMMKRRRHHQRLPTLVADDRASPSSPKESAATSMKISLNNDASASSGSGVISGQAFYITNNNSMDGIPTIYMWLYSCNPTKWLTYSITSSNGMYGFHNLPPGYYYAVAQPPEGYALSNGGNIHDTLDSAFDTESGKTICYYLKEGEKVMHWNFGLDETALNGADETTSLHSSEGSRVVNNPTRGPIARPTYLPSMSPITSSPVTFMPSKNPIPRPTFKPSDEPSVMTNEPSRSYFTLNPTIHRGTLPNSIANSVVPDSPTNNNGLTTTFPNAPSQMPSKSRTRTTGPSRRNNNAHHMIYLSTRAPTATVSSSRVSRAPSSDAAAHGMSFSETDIETVIISNDPNRLASDVQLAYDNHHTIEFDDTVNNYNGSNDSTGNVIGIACTLMALGILAAALFMVRFTGRKDDDTIYEDGDQKSILIYEDDVESSILQENYAMSDVGSVSSPDENSGGNTIGLSSSQRSSRKTVRWNLPPDAHRCTPYILPSPASSSALEDEESSHSSSSSDEDLEDEESGYSPDSSSSDSKEDELGYTLSSSTSDSNTDLPLLHGSQHSREEDDDVSLKTTPQISMDWMAYITPKVPIGSELTTEASNNCMPTGRSISQRSDTLEEKRSKQLTPELASEFALKPEVRTLSRALERFSLTSTIQSQSNNLELAGEEVDMDDYVQDSPNQGQPQFNLKLKVEEPTAVVQAVGVDVQSSANDNCNVEETIPLPENNIRRSVKGEQPPPPPMSRSYSPKSHRRSINSKNNLSRSQSCPPEDLTLMSQAEREKVRRLKQDVHTLSTVMNFYPKGSKEWQVLYSNLDLAREELSEILQDIQIHQHMIVAPLRRASLNLDDTAPCGEELGYVGSNLQPLPLDQDQVVQPQGKAADIATADGENDMQRLRSVDVDKLLCRNPSKSEPLKTPIVRENDLMMTRYPRCVDIPPSPRRRHSNGSVAFAKGLNEMIRSTKGDSHHSGSKSKADASQSSTGLETERTAAVTVFTKSEMSQIESRPSRNSLDFIPAMKVNVSAFDGEEEKCSTETLQSRSTREDIDNCHRVSEDISGHATTKPGRAEILQVHVEEPQISDVTIEEDPGAEGFEKRSISIDKEEDIITVSTPGPKTLQIQSSSNGSGLERDETTFIDTPTKSEKSPSEAATADLLSSVKQFVQTLGNECDVDFANKVLELSSPALDNGIPPPQDPYERTNEITVEEEVKSWYDNFCRKKSDEENRVAAARKKPRGVPYAIPILMWAKRRASAMGLDSDSDESEMGLEIVQEEE